jgi:hypothetical protein
MLIRYMPHGALRVLQCPPPLARGAIFVSTPPRFVPSAAISKCSFVSYGSGMPVMCMTYGSNMRMRFVFMSLVVNFYNMSWMCSNVMFMRTVAAVQHVVRILRNRSPQCISTLVMTMNRCLV